MIMTSVSFKSTITLLVFLLFAEINFGQTACGTQIDEATAEHLSSQLDDVNEFVIIEESLNNLTRIKSIIKNTKRQRTIILPILKHYKHIERIHDLFSIPELNLLLPKLGVLIIDDEADQASLNGLARRNWKNSLKKRIEDINDDDEFL